MAGHDDDGDSFFGDDDLDALPEDALDELENNAIQFTQASRYQPPPSSDYGDEFDDEDLDDAIVVDESRSAPVTTHYPHRSIPGQTPQRFQHSIANHLLAQRQFPSPPAKFHQPQSDQSLRATLQHREGDSLQNDQRSAASTPAISEVEQLRRKVEEVGSAIGCIEVVLTISS